MSCDLPSILHHIVANRALHARFLNTFSYLEYIGFRKIVKSQASELLNSRTLAHAVEEGRHALLLKKLAVRFGGAGFDLYTPEKMLCAVEAEKYFHDIDSACEEIFKETLCPTLRSRLTYICVTWVVEVRAISIYKLYQQVTETFGIKLPLTGLLADEEKHLTSIKLELSESISNYEEPLAEIKIVEESLYRQYLEAVSRAVNHA